MRGGDLRQRQQLLDAAQFERGFRHPVDDAGRLVLRQRHAAQVCEGRFRPRAPSLPMPVSRTATVRAPNMRVSEASVTSTEGRTPWTGGSSGSAGAPARVKLQVPPAGGEQGQTGLQVSPPPPPGRERRVGVQAPGQRGRESRGHVLHDDDRHAQIGGQRRDKRLAARAARRWRSRWPERRPLPLRRRSPRGACFRPARAGGGGMDASTGRRRASADGAPRRRL